MPILLALINYLTNEILILGRITFFIKQILDGAKDFLVTVLTKLCPEMKLKNNEIKKNKN